MIKPKLHHVTIKTSHLDEMITWYGLVIGAEGQFRDQVAAWTTKTLPITGSLSWPCRVFRTMHRKWITTGCTTARSNTKASKI